MTQPGGIMTIDPNFIHASSWNWRIEELLKQIVSVQGGGASGQGQALQLERLISLNEQITVLVSSQPAAGGVVNLAALTDRLDAIVAGQNAAAGSNEALVDLLQEQMDAITNLQTRLEALEAKLQPGPNDTVLATSGGAIGWSKVQTAQVAPGGDDTALITDTGGSVTWGQAVAQIAPAQVSIGSTAYLGFLNRLTGVYTDTGRSKIAEVLTLLDNAKILDVLDFLEVHTAPNVPDSLLNWVRNAYAGSRVSNPPFTVNGGYASGGGFINTNFNPVDADANFKLNNCSYGAYLINTADPGGNFAIIGASTPSISSSLRRDGYAVNGGGAAFSFLVPSNLSGLWSVIRSASNAMRYRRAGVTRQTDTNASSALVNAPIYALGEYYTAAFGGSGAGSGYQMGACYAGGALTDAQETVMNTVLADYINYRRSLIPTP